MVGFGGSRDGPGESRPARRHIPVPTIRRGHPCPLPRHPRPTASSWDFRVASPLCMCVGADLSATRRRRHGRRPGGQMPRSPMRMGSEAPWPSIGFRVVGADSSATRGRRHERRFGGQMPRSPMRMGSYEKHGGFQSVVACLSLADGVAAPQVARGRRIPARRRPVGQGAYGVPRIRPVPGLDRPGCARARVQRRGRPSSGGAIFGVRAASGSTRGSGASVTAPAAAPPSARRWPPPLPGWTDRPAPGLRGPVRCHGRPPRAGRAGPGSRSPRARSRCT